MYRCWIVQLQKSVAVRSLHELWSDYEAPNLGELGGVREGPAHQDGESTPLVPNSGTVQLIGREDFRHCMGGTLVKPMHWVTSRLGITLALATPPFCHIILCGPPPPHHQHHHNPLLS